jgi:carbon-monoxide dehydrogenase small subunit
MTSSDGPAKMEIAFSLNGMAVKAEVRPWDRLIDVLRGPLGHNGPKEGCGEGECGACTVLVDSRVVNSCIFPAPEVEGKSVITVEGLAGPGGDLSEVQAAFVKAAGIQCGFCTPGMILSATALLEASPDPTDREIREALAGNLCRCTGYVQIIESVRAAAAALRGEEEGGDGE